MFKLCVLFGLVAGAAYGQIPEENIPTPGIQQPRAILNTKLPKHRYIQTNQEGERYVPILPKTPIVPNRHQEIDAEEEEYLRQQAKSAQYSYGSEIHDGIMDGQVVREETRDGLKVTGKYSYSDGFFMRTVNYEADEHGYRVVNEEIIPIGDGPVFDPKGKADVSTSLAGSYSITGDDIKFHNNLKYKEQPHPKNSYL